MSVFTLEKREKVQEKLLEVGMELIREKGIRKMTISDVTDRTGIGKGTFYHFYPAKEFYVWDVIRYSKKAIKEAINEAVREKGALDKEAFLELIDRLAASGESNLIRYITPEDELWLKEKLPAEYVPDASEEEETAAAFLSCCKNKRGNVNPHTLANMIKIMVLAVENRDILHQDALRENLELMKEQLCCYLFE